MHYDMLHLMGQKLNKQSFLLPEIIREMVQHYTTEIKSSNRNTTLYFSSSKELESNPVIADKSFVEGFNGSEVLLSVHSSEVLRLELT